MKKRNYKIGIITLTLILVFNLVLMSVSSVFAAKPYGETGAQNEVDKTTFATRIKDAFIECLKEDSMEIAHDVAADLGPNEYNVKINYVTPAEIFKANNVFTDNTAIKVGEDIEKIINPTGKKIDGKIYCSEGSSEKNLTTLFMESMGIDNIKRLICSPNGTYALYKKDVGQEDSCSANNLNLSTRLAKKNSSESEKYINDIFSKWGKKQNSSILTGDSEKDKVSNNATMSYAEALKAFERTCIGKPGTGGDGKDTEQYSSGGGTYYYDFTIKMIKDGNSVELHPHLNQDKKGNFFPKSGDITVDYFDTSKKQLTCEQLKNTINNNFDEYKKSIDNIRKEKYVKPCASEEIKKRANEIISAYEAQQRDRIETTGPNSKVPKKLSLMSVDKAEYDTLKAAFASGDFTVDDGNGGRKCLETKNLKNCNSVEMKNKAQRIIDSYDHKIVNGTQLTDEENKELKLLSEAVTKNDFTIDDGNGGKKCLETENFNSTLPPDEEEWTAEGEYDSSTTADQKQSYCQENGGFLSWMLCPAIADGASTAGGLLGFITQLTTVHTSIIEQFSKQDSSIYKAWSAFRNIANIGFVIMLLVVVFSQVTNIGISNYNIKKILPKLIITAILVNFSYLILGVLIDLSRIVGDGIGSLIKSVAADGMDADASARASATISAIAGIVTTAAGGAGIAAAVVSGPALILPVVMFIVTSLISIFFGFIMLTIRQAAIIMVIVLAPLMMVLYALPNTSAITKKYISTIKALLMLYPMFIFATSAGALASSIIIGTSTDPLMMIVGGLLNVLPYFAVPSMTSKSLAGLGAITAGFDKIRGGALKGAGMAGGAFGASEFYKNMKSDFNADKNLNRSLGRLRRYKAIEDAGGKLTTSQRRRQTEAAGAVMKDAKMRAGGSAAAGIALSNYEGAGFAGLQAAALNELEEAEDKNNMMLFANEGYTPDDMIGMLKEASAADYSKMTDAEKSANDSRIRALTKSLMSTKAGQKAFESQIASNKDMRLSNRAFGQIAHAALKTPGLADKYQVMNNQFSSYVDGGGDTSDTKVQAGLMGSTFSNGISKTLADMNSDKLQKITKFEVGEMYKSGADTTNLDNAFDMLAAASIKDPNLIADFDGIKQEKILEAQGKYIDESQKSTINLRSGGSATIYNPPADFGKYTQTKDASGQIFYTNDRGDIFNASTGKQIKGM